MAMGSCSECGTEVPEGARFCVRCGSALTTLAQDQDHSTDFDDRPIQRFDQGQKQSLPQASAPVGARFVPGTILAGRYRIVALAGRGGMGEVYRAEDLKLDQTVALKFLPARVEQDPQWLARFLSEVRIARQISHPNVCRVYDIGEFEGRHYLSMEYIQGEDLSSLLRRIGRIPQEKALQITRQLCAGLAAAHQKGVLHRDLKPANVMLDENGVARITDFGLAIPDEAREQAHIREGTPAYMAPEQIEGREVTSRSDLYALGLILYELFTGRRPWRADTVQDLVQQQRSAPETPSSLTEGIDPLVERTILACLDPQPERRPSSARQVMAMLPGGDPMEAALAAGETPSPEAVAAAGREGTLHPAVAVGLLVLALVLIASVVLLHGRIKAYRLIALPYTPEQLALRAEQTLTELGVESPSTSIGWGLVANQAFYASTPSGSVRQDLESGRALPILFWYRASPEPLLQRGARIEPWDPPQRHTGEVEVDLTPSGHLRRLVVQPSSSSLERDESVSPTALFVEAGLEPDTFRPIETIWVAPVFADEIMTFEESVPSPRRVVMAFLAEVPVWFEVVNAGAVPEHLLQTETPVALKIFIFFLIAFYVIVLLVAAGLAWRNLKLGRGDRRGAFRVAAAAFAIVFFGWIFGGSHVWSGWEIRILAENLSMAVFKAMLVWLGYIALEPIVRRQWPRLLISWTRIWSGNWRDGMVGRDVLAGVVLGAVSGVLANLNSAHAATASGSDAAVLPINFTEALGGVRPMIVALSDTLFTSLVVGISVLVFIVLLSMIVRRHHLAAILFWVLFSVVLSLPSPNPVGITLAVVAAGSWTLTVTRFGLLSMVVAHSVFFLVSFFPIGGLVGTWYSGVSISLVGILVGLALFGFRYSLGERPLLESFRIGLD